MRQIYLDHAAATPVNPKVIAAMKPYFSTSFYNPSATYLPAQNVQKDLNKARAEVAQVLGAKQAEIIFTAGGTEANNLAIHGIMRRFPKEEILVSAIEHESVLRPSEKYNHKEVPVLPDGTVDIEKLKNLISDTTVLVSIMYANNEIGTIQPIKEIAAIVDEIKQKRRDAGNSLPLYFHTDACQAANYLDLHVSRLGVDMMTLNGGKIYGPKQSGALFVKAGIELEPFIYGGGQERGLRSGTENVAADIGFALALSLVQNNRHQEVERLQKLQKQFFELLTKHIKRAEINGSIKHRLPNNIHITVVGQDNERMLIKLEEAGVLAAAGSACSASNEEPSHVLKAIGLSDESARASLRLSMGQKTAKSHVEQAVQAIIAAIE